MKSIRPLIRIIALIVLFTSALAQAAPITGTVINKTNGKPSAGDTVVLVDVQAGMSEAARATTDARGHYSLDAPGSGPYLIRANHQGGTYFIAAPQNGGSGDITVYDVATKVEGVSTEANVFELETANGQLSVDERYYVRNMSSPPRTELNSNTFEIVLPADAVLEGASVTRPGGLPTNTQPIALSQKGHYTFNIPIQPNQGDKETLFDVRYHIPYSGKYTFSPQPQLPTDNEVVLLPKSITFTPADGAAYQQAQEDPRFQTFVEKGVHPGQAAGFTISGEGQMPREAQGNATGQQPDNGMGTDSGQAAASAPGNQPGGGIGNPINTPDPLRKQAVVADVPGQAQDLPLEDKPRPAYVPSATPAATYTAAPATGNAALMNILKEELFALESDKLSGAISPAEYAEVKVGLEAVLKRALKRNS
jgi:hypothetical protein